MAIITFTRQIAALGDEIASLVARKLDYKFVGRLEIEAKLVELGFPKSKLHQYDERKPGFFASLAKDRDEYLDYLKMAVLEAVCENNCVLIGRGAFVILQSLLNRLSVRLVSDDYVRVERLMNEFSCTEKEAKARINKSDSNRRGFHKSFFNVDNENSVHYHMVLNSSLLDMEIISEIVSQAVKFQIDEKKELEGQKKISELLTAQKLVNTLVFDHKININFLTATINQKKVMLHGVADSSAIIDKAISISSRELPDYKIESSISVVQDFRNRV